MTKSDHPSLSPIYKVYSELPEIDPYSVETEEQEDLYYKSLLWGCKNCDLVSENKMYMAVHYCSRNNKSKYYEHQQEFINRKIDKLNKENY